MQMSVDRVQIYQSVHELSPETGLVMQFPRMALDPFAYPEGLRSCRNSRSSTTRKVVCPLQNICSTAVAAGPVCASVDGFEASDAPRIWILAERFSGGGTNSEILTREECSSLYNLQN